MNKLLTITLCTSALLLGLSAGVQARPFRGVSSVNPGVHRGVYNPRPVYNHSRNDRAYPQQRGTYYNRGNYGDCGCNGSGCGYSNYPVVQPRGGFYYYQGGNSPYGSSYGGSGVQIEYYR